MNFPGRLLQDYFIALASRDMKSIERIARGNCLFEVPFLQPTRLFGAVEIASAHREIFANLESVDIVVNHIESNASHAIAEVQLEYTRNGEDSCRLPAGVVTETDGDKLRRLSIYCDARNLRRWSDRRIL